MKKQLCKTFRTMAAKLPQVLRETHETFYHKGNTMHSERKETKHPVNHYRRLKRIFTREGVKGVELYYKKHVA